MRANVPFLSDTTLRGNTLKSMTLRATEAKPIVLLADEDPLILAAVGRVLRGGGFEVFEVVDSASALDACVRLKPALAIVDYAMPGTNGVELARLITTRTAVPLICLSAFHDEQIVRDAIAAGAMTYLIKPIDTLQVLPAVHTALQRASELNALREQTHQLSSALQIGRTVNVATGLVMAKFQIGQQEALERMRSHARSRRIRLEAVASELLKAMDEAGKLYESLGQRNSPSRPHGNGGDGDG